MDEEKKVIYRIVWDKLHAALGNDDSKINTDWLTILYWGK
jgi:hypothetical protein